jgi:hypothetical protein
MGITVLNVTEGCFVPMRWTIGPVSAQKIIIGLDERALVTFQLTDTQKVSVVLTFVDAKGAPAPINGVPTWASSVPTVAAVTPAADGLSAEIVAGVPGLTQISVTADASLTDVPVIITGTLDLTVVSGQAATITMSPGVPVAQ